MAIDYEIFDGKSLSSLFKDIYDNTEYNKKQLDILTKELVQFIKDGDTAVQIVPMIKEYLEINVKNDDQLVKMAGIVQRLISAENKAGSEDEYGLTEEEKNQLMSNIKDTVVDLQSESDKIHNKINTMESTDVLS
jgi:predicted RND superfamily exporter protein|tara:strand:+ start:92 stop:496 length:405 start_codon:yes stop_codon:yes gene_type:complete